MKLRRPANKMIVEPPSVATGDIAFNLLVFFLVCASSMPDKGRKQDIPTPDKTQQQNQEVKNVEVLLTRTTGAINGKITGPDDFAASIMRALEGKTEPSDRVVIVKSNKDVPYDHWIRYTGFIEEARAIVTLQLEEEQTVYAN
jgi:biopolymer transport protein ExbD